MMDVRDIGVLMCAQVFSDFRAKQNRFNVAQEVVWPPDRNNSPRAASPRASSSPRSAMTPKTYSRESGVIIGWIVSNLKYFLRVITWQLKEDPAIVRYQTPTML